MNNLICTLFRTSKKMSNKNHNLCNPRAAQTRPMTGGTSSVHKLRPNPRQGRTMVPIDTPPLTLHLMLGMVYPAFSKICAIDYRRGHGVKCKFAPNHGCRRTTSGGRVGEDSSFSICLVIHPLRLTTFNPNHTMRDWSEGPLRGPSPRNPPVSSEEEGSGTPITSWV